jgi:hypothetical protein
MDLQKALLVIGITLAIVIVFNLAIYAAVKRRGGQVGEIELFGRVLKKARDPWRDEKANLEVLSKQVANLQRKDHNESISDDQQTNVD